jgi:voltage-gated sodium channel
MIPGTGPFSNWCRRLADSDGFERLIICVITLNALTMGLETAPDLSEAQDEWFSLVFLASQWLFVFEIAVRLGAHAPRFNEFFRGFWNIFDFTIVALSLLPEVGAFVLTARILRVLRVLRFISVSDELRGFVRGLGVSLPVMCYTGIVAAVLWYVFSVSAFYLFSGVEPANWGSLPRCAGTLACLLLLQDVVRFTEPLLQQHSGAVVFFTVFYLSFLALGVNAFAAVVALHLGRGKEAA